VVITEPFQGLAATFAAALGTPGYHVVTVPHPISSKDDERLAAIAGSVAALAAAQLGAVEPLR